MSIRTPDSPCQGYCTTYHGDLLCKACGRTVEEVFGWIGFTDAEKQAVWDRLNAKALEPDQNWQCKHGDPGLEK